MLTKLMIVAVPVALGTICLACAPRQRSSELRPTTTPDPQSAHAESSATPAEPIVDTEFMLVRDPQARTWIRLHGLRMIVREFRQKHGRLPELLREFMPEPDTEWIHFRYDGWGNPIRYSRKGHDFHLMSAGADGVFGNTDDLVASENSVIPI